VRPAFPPIDRQEAWGVASRAMAAACERRGSLSLIHGTGGLGKSELLTQVRAQATRELGMDALAATGQAHEREFAFGVVLQLLEGRLARGRDEELTHLLSGTARQALPLFEPDPRGGLSVDPFELLHGLYRICAKLAERAPLLLTVDDVDLADEQSLRFLLHLSVRLEDLPVAVMLTASSLGQHKAPRLVTEISRHPATRRANLVPLDSEATARRVREGWLPAAPESACRAIQEATAGNPLLIDALAGEMVTSDGSVGLTAAGIERLAPAGIADWALTRADRLDPQAPGLLGALTILGPSAELRHVAGLAGVNAEQAATIADGLVEYGLLSPDEPLSFAQPVVGRSVEGSLSLLERATLHRRASRLMSAEDAPAHKIAAHLMAATKTGSGWAVEALSEAASGALDAGRPADAVRFLQRALEEPPPRRLRTRLVFELGCAEATAGVPDAARRLSEAVDAVAAASERVPRPLDAGRALFALGRPEEATAILDLGLAQTGDGDPDFAKRLQAARASSALFAERAHAPTLGEPPPSGESAGDRATLAVHALEGAVHSLPCAEVRELAERALGHGDLLDDETADGPVLYLPAFALSVAGDLQTAEAVLTAAVEEARTRGSVLGFANASHMRSVAILLRGRVADAAADARQALAAERQGWRLSLSGAHGVLANCLMERGDHRAARRHLAGAERVPHAHALTWSAVLLTRARLALLEGDLEKALAGYMECGALGEDAGAENPAISPWRSGGAIACSLLGRAEEAAELAETELKLAEKFASPAAIGRALRALGTIRGPERGLEALETAVDQLERSQAALERARGLVEFGAALRRAGRRRDAREPLRRGLDLAQRCGAEALVARAKDEARIAGARPRRIAVSGIDSLTERERQVAQLAARGMSNRQIADTLVVTLKTVEFHLGNSFRKLDVGSRAKLRELLDG
jgi:DNA-binding CsgD family transcriptional regulator